MVASNVYAVYDSYICDHVRLVSHDVVNFILRFSVRASPYINIYQHIFYADSIVTILLFEGNTTFEITKFVGNKILFSNYKIQY